MALLQIKERQKEILVKGAAGVLTLVLCYLFMIHPVFSQIRFLKGNISESQERIKLSAAIKEQKKKMVKMEEGLASLQERAMILGRISDLANKAKMDVQSLTPKTQAEGNYTKLTVEVDGKSSFLAFHRFLQEVEKADLPLNVRDVSVLRQRFENQPKESRNLQVHLILETYLMQNKKK
ncbi:MAG TPA: type 4a pilus biogenesis protein PilO [Candidatus Omnitrophota bacterium]|nr:type 4a pilus biogenesis protein PilO [Candidatus Omnitrophota bacterium]